MEKEEEEVEEEVEVEVEEEVVGKPCSSETHQLPVREPEQDDKWE